MLKKSIIVIFLGALVALHSSAKPYVGIKGGFAYTARHDPNSVFFGSTGKELKSSGLIGGTLGYRFNEIFRCDVEGLHRVKSTSKYYQGDKQSGDKALYKSAFSATSFMLNGYAEMPINAIRPFVTFGLGVSYNKLFDVYSFTSQGIPSYSFTKALAYKGKRKISSAWQGGVGVSFSHKNFVCDGEIKYIDRGKAVSKTVVDQNTPTDHLKIDIREFLFLASIKYYL